MPITHEWNGTILTITTDSGSSSCDLKGEKGDDGARGAQGIAGSCVAEDTSHLGGIPAAQYATIDYVESAIDNAQISGGSGGDIDLTMYATKNYVDTAIANYEPPVIDLSGYATKDYVDDAIELYELPEETLKDYATKKYVDDAISGIDVGGGGSGADMSNYYTKAQTNAAIAAAQYVPPVGIILPFWNDTEPAALYANTTWELIAVGQTIIQSGSNYPLGSTGGSSSHNHSLNDDTAYAAMAFKAEDNTIQAKTGANGKASWYSSRKVSNLTMTGGSNVYFGYGSAIGGETSPAEAMPPYLAINLWKRTA